jgi:hypothetical protein
MEEVYVVLLGGLGIPHKRRFRTRARRMVRLQRGEKRPQFRVGR